MRHLLIGTAGHVDHGKTSLIRALTGTDTDRLAEEQARGMTIDLGFAFLALPGGIDAGIVDVPGHERFVKNLLAGAGGIDVALLAVAADAGPMPQTLEHLDILTALDVRVGVVALTRADLVDDEGLALCAELTQEALAGSTLAGSPLVPVSATTGAGLDALTTALARAAQRVPERRGDGPARMPVDRVFSLPGVGTVVTGTLASGTLRAGDPVEVQPQGLVSKARTLQSHNRRIDVATPGMRVAVGLPGIEVGQLKRGAVLATPGTIRSGMLLDARLSVLPSASKPLAHRERVRLHLGAGELLARVHLLDGAAIEPGQAEVPVQLVCETPAAAARGERFVLRRYSPARTIGGGIVVEPSPARRYRKGDAEARALFAARGTGALADGVHAALAARHVDLSPDELAASVGAPVDAALGELVASGRAAALPDGRFVSDTAASRLRDTARRALADFHRKTPLRRAMPRESLRAPLAKAATVRDFAGLLAWLAADGVLVLEGTTGARLPDHEIRLPAGWREAADEIQAVYDAAGFQPPWPGAFTYPRHIVVTAILDVLVEEEKLVRLSDDILLSAAAVATAREVVRRLAKTPEGITVGSVRDATGSSRKVILPLLEYFDARRITRRVGDKRTLME